LGKKQRKILQLEKCLKKEFKAARMAGKDVFEFMGRPYNTKTLEEVEGMMYGGEMKRYANGGEIENMLSGMDSGEQEAMGELEQMAPEMEMIDQLVNMVVQMIQQGAGEEQVISFLREQGLDDEDIGTVLQLVAEMAETEEVAAQNEIGCRLRTTRLEMIERNLLDQTKDLRGPQRMVQSNFGMEEQRRIAEQGLSQNERVLELPNQGGGMPANPDGRSYAGGSPGLYAPGGKFSRVGGIIQRQNDERL
jgi:hypothetical protein